MGGKRKQMVQYRVASSCLEVCERKTKQEKNVTKWFSRYGGVNSLSCLRYVRTPERRLFQNFYLCFSQVQVLVLW